jgi:hypothetical protein
LLLASHGEEQLELGWELILGVETIGEVDSSDTAVSVDLHSQGLDVVGTVGSSSEIRQVELNLVPALIKSHGHSTDEGLYPGGTLIVRGSETAANVLVIKHLDLKGEVLLKL